MKIHSNTSAIIANNALATSDRKLSLSIERLSSGYKVNHAKDNPAGLAIAKKMRAQIRGLENASQNAGDGISVVESAEGALAEVHSIIQRLNELAVKGSTGTISNEDRAALEAEADQLKAEINRIAENTEFNGSPLLDGNFDLKGYTTNKDIKVESYTDSAKLGVYTISNITVARDLNGNLTNATTVTLDTAGGKPNGEQPFPPVQSVSVDGNTLTIKCEGDFELKLDIQDAIGDGGTINGLKVDLTGIGDMRLQVGANEGQVLEVRIPTVSLKTLGIDKTTFATNQGCQDALTKMSDALSAVSSIRSRLGAYQNRLEHTTDSLDVTNENMTAAYSRIMDTDMAKEMTEYTKNQVLVQAGTSMLAQANERPSQVLQLLQ